ncbi:MAG: folate family ECF transporter S component, partial [Clostridia bacterium]|nr:folate family ECF transporter S component [Clostridia bacterium]
MTNKEKSKTKFKITTRVLTYSAVLAALSVVLARLISLVPSESSRFSIESIPIFLAGAFFGPVVGGLVGFTSDLVGCLFSPFGYNPFFCIPAILYGVFGGLIRFRLAQSRGIKNLLWVCGGYFPPIVFGSILYQSLALAYFYRYDPEVPGSFLQGLQFFLTTRGVQFAIILVIDILVTYLLLKTGVFRRIGVWPPQKKSAPTPAVTEITAEEYLKSVRHKGSVLGLERIRELLRLMGNPQDRLKFIHIAGTNGKGSTAALIESVLRKSGKNTGLFTSPCIAKINEQIKINGKDVSDEELNSVSAYMKRFTDTMDEPPTEFELICCMAFELFCRNQCDIVVLEVGMGGETDATNVIGTPEVAVITNIGLDHTAFLGNKLEDIARVKSGIIKENGTTVIYRSDLCVEETLETVCKNRNNKLIKADFDSLISTGRSFDGQSFSCGERKDLFIPLLGEHQLKNAAVALSVIDVMREKGTDVSEESIKEGFRSVCWPGRFELVSRSPLFIVDGGHNPQCLDSLAENIKLYLSDRRIIALTGVLADKDYENMYAPVLPLIDKVVCITPPNPRKLEAEKLAEHFKKDGADATACASIASGVETALRLAGEDGAVLCFGSLYSLAEIKEALA